MPDRMQKGFWDDDKSIELRDALASVPLYLERTAKAMKWSAFFTYLFYVEVMNFNAQLRCHGMESGLKLVGCLPIGYEDNMDDRKIHNNPKIVTFSLYGYHLIWNLWEFCFWLNHIEMMQEKTKGSPSPHKYYAALPFERTRCGILASFLDSK